MILTKTLATMLCDAINVCILGEDHNLIDSISLSDQQKALCGFLNLVKVRFPDVAQEYNELWFTLDLGDNELL